MAKLIIGSALKKHRNNSLLLPALIACLGLMVAGRVTAQTFKTLYSFNGNGDGANPYAGVILSGNVLYGTTQYGSLYQQDYLGGADVFAINTDGTGFRTVLGYPGFPYLEAGVILSGDTLYSTAMEGNSGYGNVFAVNTDGTGFRIVHSFTATANDPTFNPPYSTYTNSGGAYLYAGLVSSGNTLYGTARAGGTGGRGTVFAVNTDASGFTNLHSFSGGDGGGPTAGLVLSNNTLYGTTPYGGILGGGTVFAIKTDGSGFTNLCSFPPVTGIVPYASSLILAGETLLGTTTQGGTANNGLVYAVNTDGTGLTNLHSFAPPFVGNPFGIFTNNEGGLPAAGLLLSGHTLYGTASRGGRRAAGTIYAVNTDGTGFTNLYDFTYGIDGGYPNAVLVQSGNTLYGTTEVGGSLGYGTVFSISFTPTLTITPSGPNVILTWPTNVAGFDYTGYTLQSTTSLDPPAWSAVSPPPVIVNGLNTVTNAISGTQMFYRLIQ